MARADQSVTVDIAVNVTVEDTRPGNLQAAACHLRRLGRCAMLRTKTFDRVSFVHQSDYSGNVSLVVPADAVDVDERLGLVTVQVPFKALQKFVDGYNRERILKAKDNDDIIIVLVGVDEKIND